MNSPPVRGRRQWDATDAETMSFAPPAAGLNRPSRPLISFYCHLMLEFVVVVNGVPGAGKTTLAAPLAEALDLPLVGKDALKEALFDSVNGRISRQALGPITGLPVIVVRTDRDVDVATLAAQIDSLRVEGRPA